MERGPLGLRRPLSIGPFAGEDAIVAVRISGEAPEVPPPRAEDNVPQIVNVLADAVAAQTGEFTTFRRQIAGKRGEDLPTGDWLLSQAPVAVGQEFDHFTVILYYPDSSISKRDVRSIRNEIQLRTERAESVNVMRV